LRGLEEEDGDAAGWDVVAAEVGDEALELFESGLQAARPVVFIVFLSNFWPRWSMRGYGGGPNGRRALFDNQLNRNICAAIRGKNYVWPGRFCDPSLPHDLW